MLLDALIAFDVLIWTALIALIVVNEIRHPFPPGTYVQ